MSQTTINTTDSPETGRVAINANFAEVYNINNLLPSQTGNANKFLKTNGSTVSWGDSDGASGSFVGVFLQQESGTNTIQAMQNTIGTVSASYAGVGIYDIIFPVGTIESNTFISCALSFADGNYSGGDVWTATAQNVMDGRTIRIYQFLNGTLADGVSGASTENRISLMVKSA